MLFERPSWLRPNRHLDRRAKRRALRVESLEQRQLLSLTGGTGPGGFELANGATPLALWLDGSDLDANGLPDSLTDGSTVSAWLDKSGYGRHAAGREGTPTYVAASAVGNNAPAVGFSSAGGDDQLYTVYNFDNLGANYTAFAVSRYTGGDNERVVTSRTRNWLFGHQSNGDQRWHADGWIVNSGNANTDFHVYAGIIGPAVNGNASDPGADFWKDGVQLGNNATGSSNTTYKPGQLAVGAYGTGPSESSNAEVAQVILFDRALNEAERLVVENYLSSKYNLAIGTEDRYAGDEVGNGDYDLDVFGVGRVDASNQLLDAGSAGFGIQVSTLDDGDFVLAGHKQTANGKTTAGTLPAGVTARWSRVWNVDVTDANDNVGATLSFDYSDSGLTRTTEDKFALLKSTDGGSTWTAVATTSAVTAGDKVSFAVSAADLGDALYTLGDASVSPIVAAAPAPVAAPLGGATTVIDGSLTVSDPDSANLAGAVVEITAGAVAGDTLAAGALTGGIAVDGSSTATRLVLAGSATVANYQAALRGATYSNANAGASTAPRTITFTVTDPDTNSGSDARLLVPTTTASADTIVWQGDVSSAWTDPGNWNLNRVPDANDIALFNDPDSVSNTVDVTGSAVVGEVRFVNSTDSFTFTGTTVQTDKLTQSGAGTNTIQSTITQLSTLAGTVSAGRLVLDNTGSSTTLTAGLWTVSGGTLVAKTAGTVTGLGQADVDLAGGTMEVAPGAATMIAGLMQYGYHINNDALAMNLHNNAGMVNGNPPNPAAFSNFFGKALLTNGPGGRGLDFNDDNDFINSGCIGQVDNYSNLFLGTLHVDAARAGNWDFAIRSTDDPSGIWIDLDRDGVFESTVAGLGSDRGEQVLWLSGSGQTGVRTVNLAAGDYMIAFTQREGGGGSAIEVRYKAPGMSAEATIKPSDPAQAGLWLTQAVPAGAVSNNVTVSANSQIVLAATLPGAKFGTLTMDPGTTLSVNSVDAKQDLEFASVVLNGDATILGIGTPDVTLANISETAAAGITFSGTVRAVLPTQNSYTGLTTIRIGATATATALGALGTVDAGTVVESGGSLGLRGGTLYSLPEAVTLSGNGNPNSAGAFHGGSGNNDFYGPITLAADAAIRNDSNNLRLLGGIDNAGFLVTLGGDGGSVEILSNGIQGSGGVRKEGTSDVNFYQNADATMTYSGVTTVAAGVLDVRGNSSLGSTAAGTVVLNGATLRIRDGRTLGDDIAITGLGYNGAGAIRNENNANTLTGTITVTGASRIHANDTSLRLDGQVTGTGTIDKTGVGTLILTNAANDYASIALSGGELRIANTGALGGTTSLSVDRNESLEFDGTMTINSSVLTTLTVDDGALRSISGTTTIDIPITLGPYGDITFDGAGDLVVNGAFGNGAASWVINALRHFGYHVNSDSVVMDLNNNAGMVNGNPPNPTAFQNFYGHAFLTSGPGNRGLDFNDDNDFIATGCIGQADNYSNLFLGTLHVDAAEAGNWQFQIAVQDDPTGIWIDLDRDGVFESSTAGLGIDRGEQLRWNNTSVATVNLAAGDYMIAFTHREGGGGSQIDARIKAPSWSALRVVKPDEPQQAGLWPLTIVPDNFVVKNGAGTLTLAGDNSFNGALTVNGGTVVAAHDNAIGADGGDILMAPGATLAFSGGVTIDGENVTGADGKAAGRIGTLVNLDGDNAFLGDVTASAIPNPEQELTIASLAGTLSLGAAGGGNTLDLSFDKLVFDGPGSVVVHSNLQSKTSPEAVGAFRAYLFNGNTTRLPNDPNQLAMKYGTGQAWFPNEIDFINFWGERIIGLNNAGNPMDPNNYGNTFIGDLTIEGTGTADVKFRHTSADDANRIRIDLNGNGVFESGTEDPYNGDQGGTYTSGTVSVPRGVPLAVALQQREGAGGARIQAEISLDNGTTWQRFATSGMTGATFTTAFTPTVALEKRGTGTATLAGDNSAYEAPYTVLEGVLVAASPNALGTTGAGTTVADDASLGFSGNVSVVAEPVTVGHFSTPGKEAIVNLDGVNRFAGDIQVVASQGTAGIRSDAGELTLAGTLTLSISDLTVAGDADTVIEGQVIGDDVLHHSAYEMAVLGKTGLNAYYRFEESAGATTAEDASTNDRDGTYLSGADTGLGAASAYPILGGALDFDGANDEISLTDATTLGIQGGSFTAMAWINGDTFPTGDRSVFGTIQGGTNVGLHLIIRNSKVHMGFYGNDLGGVQTLSTGTWYHVVWRYDISNGQQAIFVNGVQDNQRTGAAAFAGTDIVRIGRWGGGNWFDGRIDEPAIFGRALSNQEILDLYNAGSGMFDEPIDSKLTKTGGGTLTLENDNVYSAGTEVLAGTLLVSNTSGSGTGSGTVTVSGTGTLGGTGTVGGAVVVQAAGAVNPGASPGTLTTGAVTFEAGSTLAVELDGLAAGTGYDQLRVNGSVDLAGGALSIARSFVPPDASTFVLIDNDGTSDAVLNPFVGLPEGATINGDGIAFRITYQGGDGNDVVLTRVPFEVGSLVVDAGQGVDGDDVLRQIGGGTVEMLGLQHSMVTRIVLTVNGVATLDPGAFALVRTGTGGGPLTLDVAPQLVGGTTIVTVTIAPGSDFAYARAADWALADGDYKLTVDATKIHDAGGPLGTTATDYVFHRFFGDSDGDRDVDATDMNRYRRVALGDPAFAAYAYAFDQDGNGAADAADYQKFRQNYGRKLRPAPGALQPGVIMRLSRFRV